MSNVANKDEAYNCLQLATKHLRNGNIDHALKYLHKSYKLYPTDEVVQLIDKINKQQADGPPPPSSSASSNTTSSNTPPPSSNATTSSQYTSDDIQIVTQIKSGKTHYDVLGLSNNKCSEKDIKIAYRKLAIKVHPDKNKGVCNI